MNRSQTLSIKLVVGAGAAVAMLSFAPSALAQERYAAIVMDARTNEILMEDQADEARFPASLTKMMTLYMLFEALERGDVTMNTRMVASRAASRMPASRLGLRRGDTITVEQAIEAIVVQSANDVAVVVAERLGGTEARFAAQMTTRARALGMTGTRFANASGLPNPALRSTARDMATLGQALWRDFPDQYHYFQTSQFSWRNRSIHGHNRLLGAVDGVDGIKTGYTRASGFNLVTSAVRGDRRVIVVVMGGETAAARDAQVAYLLEGAYQEFARRQVDTSGVSLANLPTNRLDVRLSPSAGGGVSASVSPATPQGTVLPATSNVQMMLPSSVQMDGQGDQEETTEEEPISTAPSR
jgi:D-alanyl-D-alanine carboxypeptidase